MHENDPSRQSSFRSQLEKKFEKTNSDFEIKTSDSESDSDVSSVSGASWNSSRSHSVNSNIGAMKPVKKMQAIPDPAPGHTDNSSWNDSHKVKLQFWLRKIEFQMPYHTAHMI